ncbi:MAG TPA: protein translocase subunit SecF, partial [Caulobacteraceae bacterium]|nr:protein translocase subunit SecF [Caulobacteraceae bacterium]
MAWPLIRNLPHHFTFNFVRLAPFAAAISVLLVIGSGVSLATQGLNLGIDFSGGSSFEVKTPGPVPLAQLRADLPTMGAHDAQVQALSDSHSARVRFKPAKGVNAVSAAADIQKKLATQFPGMQFQGGGTVGAKVSGELLVSGFQALGIAMVLMLLYIWFRFQLQFGLGAVIAILHDVALTIGFLSFQQIEFSMVSIAALLTVIGYSMNEKVITFDRLRENLRKYKRTPLRDVINLSENERLSRTLITGSTALLALAGMLFLGGPALFPLIITMVVGIVLGTYSSIYVALPVIML